MSGSGSWRPPQDDESGSRSGSDFEFELSLEEEPLETPAADLPAEAPADRDDRPPPPEVDDEPPAEHILSSEGPVPFRPRRPVPDLGPDPRSGQVARAWRDLPAEGPPAELDALVRAIALEAIELEASEATVQAEVLPGRPRWLLPAGGAAALLVLVAALLLVFRSPGPEPGAQASPARPSAADAVPQRGPSDETDISPVPEPEPPQPDPAEVARVADAQALDNLERVIPLIPDAAPAGDFPEPEAVALYDVLGLYDSADFNGAAIALVDFQAGYPLHPVSQLLAMRAEAQTEPVDEDVLIEPLTAERVDDDMPLEALTLPAAAP